MKSNDPMSENEIDKNLADSFPASDPPSWTVGTDHKSKVIETSSSSNRKTLAAGWTLEIIFHKLAKVFNGLHWAIGITTLPAEATPREERSFVLMWLGILVFIAVFFAFFIYWL